MKVCVVVYCIWLGCFCEFNLFLRVWFFFLLLREQKTVCLPSKRCVPWSSYVIRPTGYAVLLFNKRAPKRLFTTKISILFCSVSANLILFLFTFIIWSVKSIYHLNCFCFLICIEGNSAALFKIKNNYILNFDGFWFFFILGRVAVERFDFKGVCRRHEPPPPPPPPSARRSVCQRFLLAPLPNQMLHTPLFYAMFKRHM